MKDGRLKVYDSDDYDINDYDNTASNIAFAYSKNPRSINSRQFKVDVEDAKKVSFAVRPGMFWSDYKGNKTKYRVKARDFLAKFLIGRFSYLNPLIKFGGSKELNDYWLKKTNSTRYKDVSEEYSDYIDELYGIDIDSSYDYDLKGKNKPIESLVVEGKPIEVLSFYVKNTDNKDVLLKGGLRNFLNLDDFYLNTFSAYPSSYNEELARRSKDDKLGEGLVKRLRYYPYGVTIKDTLFAGRYMPVSDEFVGGKETTIYKKNPNFFDRKWVESIDNVRKIVIERYSQETSDFQTANYVNFVQGQTLDISFSALPQTYARKILEGKDPYINKDQIYWHYTVFDKPETMIQRRSLIKLAPEQAKDKEGRLDTSVYQFNDNFARFMYGADLKTIAEGKARTFMHFFGDDQISFRSLIQAGVNWLQYAKYVTKKNGGTGIYTYSPAPLFVDLNGSDRTKARFKTVFDAYEDANSYFVVVNGKRAIEIPYKANVEGMKELRESDSFKGGGKVIYAKLQEAMTELLDRVYAKGILDTKEKIKAVFIPFLTNPNEEITLATKNMVDALNNLDKKGRLDLSVHWESSWEVIFFKRFFSGGYHGDGSDFSLAWKGNASGLQGLVANIDRKFILPYVTEVLAKRDEKDPNNLFPLLTRLGKLFNKGLKEGRYKIKSKLSKFFDLTNKQLNDFFIDAKSPLIYDPKLPDFQKVMVKFFFDIQDHFTNEEMIGLNREVAVIYGWVNVEPLFLPEDPRTGERSIRQYGYNSNGSIMDATFDPLPKEEQIFD